jgi:macrolide-specific efflux system membrane fusion protein
VRRFVLVVLALILLLAGVAAFRTATAPSSDSTGQTTSVRVTRRDIARTVKATGVIKPRVGAEVRVGSRVSGVVNRLLVQIGDRVAPGQLLAELDDRDPMARRDEAAAALESANANLAFASAELQRKQRLAESGLVSANDLDLARRASAVAVQQRAQAQASLDFAAAQLGYTRLFAPIGGVVSSISTQEGETVAASFAAPTFLTLLDLSRLEVRAYVDETDIGRIAIGQKAAFTVDTFGDEAFDGRVSAIYPQAEIRDNVVNYITVVRFVPPRDRILRPEMTATVRVALATRSQVLALPIRAVRRESDRPFVWVSRGPARERTWITTGSRDDTYWEITSGVGEGDSVVLGDVAVPTAEGQS